jgi:hypothetical protein
MYVWNTAPVQKFTDAATTETVMGSQAPLDSVSSPTIQEARFGSKQHQGSATRSPYMNSSIPFSMNLDPLTSPSGG